MIKFLVRIQGNTSPKQYQHMVTFRVHNQTQVNQHHRYTNLKLSG